MNIIKDEKIHIDGNKVTLTTICVGDIGFIKELQYIRLQRIIDIIVNGY